MNIKNAYLWVMGGGLITTAGGCPELATGLVGDGGGSTTTGDHGNTSSTGETSGAGGHGTAGHAAGGGGTGAGTDGGACMEPCPIWAKRFGSSDAQYISRVALSNTGNVVIAGGFRNKIDLGGGVLTATGVEDIFLAELTQAGKYVWGKVFTAGVGTQSTVKALTTSLGDVIVSGDFKGALDFGGGPLVSAGSLDVFLVKFDSAGNHLWSKRFGSANSENATALGSDPSGQLYLAGVFPSSSPVDLGGGPLVSAGDWDIFLAKFNGAGVHQWSKRFGGVHGDELSDLACEGSGVIITGRFEGSAIDFGGGQLVGTGGDDAFLAKLDTVGNHVWSRRFGDGNNQYGQTVAVDAQGGSIVFSGRFQGNIDLGGDSLGFGDDDFYVAKFDGTGTHVWSKKISNTGFSSMNVGIDGLHNIVVTGVFTGMTSLGGSVLTNEGGPGMFIGKWNSVGDHVWSAGFGTDVTASTVAVSWLGDAYAAGAFFGSVDFGFGKLVSAGQADAFVVKFAP